MTPRRLLIIVGSLSMAVYGVILWLSWRFEFVGQSLSNADQYALLRQRPIVPVLVCFAVLFGLYLLALAAALKCESDARLIPTLFGFSVGFRLILLTSEPIQEVDIYRYLWDGEVVRAGVSPFRYSPQQILDAKVNDPMPADLRKLVERRDASPAVSEILGRVHYGHLPTVYPPFSQAVFALATSTMPQSTGVRGRVIIMRAWLLLFDLATAWLLFLTLRQIGKPAGWVVAYAWCPLVMKEFANSGHLDSIAVCLTTAAIYCSIKAFFPQGSGIRLATGTFAATLLALAVGAKLYPVVLAPLLAATALRRGGWRAILLPGAVFILLTGVVCAPMLPRASSDADAAASSPSQVAHMDSSQPNGKTTSPQDPSRGLSTFLRRWEMNDFLFLLLVENLDPAVEKPIARQAWFVVTPREWRESVVEQVWRRFNWEEYVTPFLLTRILTSGCFLLLALRWSLRTSAEGTAERFLELTFLTLAWFWLLLPTQNPWYWIWSLPFVPFARSRVWLAMSGCVMIYYLRFWLGYHWPESQVAGTRYSGTAFFDFVVTWVEFGPWFIALAISRLMANRNNHQLS